MNILEQISNELVDELVQGSVVPRAVTEVDVENAVHVLLEEVCGTMAAEVARYELHTYQRRIEYEEESIDKTLIGGECCARAVYSVLIMTIMIIMMMITYLLCFMSHLCTHRAREAHNL